MTSLESVPAGALPPADAAALAAQGELSAAVSGRCSRADVDRLGYARDAWPLGLLLLRHGRVPKPPDLVVWPASEDEVAAVIGIARRRRVPVIPFGAGSGVCGGTWAVRGGIAVDLKRLDRIGAVDEAARAVEVEAGVVGEVLERRLNAQGWTLGHFPTSMYMSTVGGWLASRSAGQLSGRYGKIEDMVLSVTAVLGTGERVVTPERPFSGPDVAQLLLGSEGTLCAFTRARLRVCPLPAGRAFHAYDFKKLEDGVEALRLMFRSGLRPAVARLHDPLDTAMLGEGRSDEAAGVSPSAQAALQRDVLPALFRVLAPQTLGRAGWLNQAARLLRKSRLLVIFEGETARVNEEDAAARLLCGRLGALDVGPEPAERWLRARYDGAYRVSKVMEGGAFADTFDVAAPWDKVLAVYERVREAAAPYAFVLGQLPHAYAEGCALSFQLIGAASSDRDERERYETLWRVVLSAAQSAGANVSHHSGIGLLRARALQDALGDGRHALRALKQAFDPDGIMNPGKLGL